jgi:uncharacterized protein (DUF58 family)
MRSSRTSSPSSTSAERLLDEALLRALAGLSLPRRRSPGAVEGAHAGTRGGRGEDFFQHRAYAWGEDLRTVDFRASARSSHLLVKELHRPLRQPLVLAVDLSASMGLYGKDRCALQLGAAVAVLGLRRGDPVAVLGLEGQRLMPLGRLGASTRPTLAVEALFAAVPPAGQGELFRALAADLPVSTAGAHLVLLSDLYGEPAQAQAALEGLVPRTGALSVLQVLAPEERALPADLQSLRDAETGEAVAVAPDDAAGFAARVQRWRAALRGVVRSAGGEWLDVDAAAPVGRTVRGWLAAKGRPR